MPVKRAAFARSASSKDALEALVSVSSTSSSVGPAVGKPSEVLEASGYDFARGYSEGEDRRADTGGFPAEAARGRIVRACQVELPPRQAAARAFKPKATLTVELEGGGACELKLPTSFARTLKQDAVNLPCPADSFFQELERLEQRACSGELLSLLERRDHSREEARCKLARRGYLPRFIEPALDEAESRRFISDARYAVYFIDEKKRAGWGRRRIEAELRRRGVSVEELEGYPDGFFRPESEFDRARAALARKRVPENRAFEKLVRFLMGRGFSYAVAADAVRERLESIGDA